MQRIRLAATWRHVRKVPVGCRYAGAVSFFDTPRAPAHLDERGLMWARRRTVAACLSIHVSLGGVMVWSLYNEPLMKHYGTVAQASGDWSLAQVVPVFSIAITMGGVVAFIVSNWTGKAGPRRTGLIGSSCMLLSGVSAAAGVHFHCLPLLYMYGVFAGGAIGFTYVPPVALAMRWFPPDRKGLASGITLMGFGGSGVLMAPVVNAALSQFAHPPIHIGDGPLFQVVNGVTMSICDGVLKEVVVLDRLVGEHLVQSVYQVGTGSTGVCGTFLFMGLLFAGMSTTASLAYLEPPTVPHGHHRHQVLVGVTSQDAVRSRAFWLQWITFFNVAAGGLAAVAMLKTMTEEIFSPLYPHLVTPAFASFCVMGASAANLSGRIGWSLLCDTYGHKRVFALMTCLSAPCYALLPVCIYWAKSGGGLYALGAFYTAMFVIHTCFGGVYAALPAYEVAVFGEKHVNAIHSRMLSASAAASQVGPLAFAELRQKSEHDLIHHLATSIDPIAFESRFGLPLDQLSALIETKAVTLQNMAAFANVPVPTTDLYTLPLQYCAVAVAAACVANYNIQRHPSLALPPPQHDGSAPVQTTSEGGRPTATKVE